MRRETNVNPLTKTINPKSWLMPTCSIVTSAVGYAHYCSQTVCASTSMLANAEVTGLIAPLT